MSDAKQPNHAADETSAATVAARKLPQRRTGLSQVFQARQSEPPTDSADRDAPAQQANLTATTPDGDSSAEPDRLATTERRTPASRLRAFEHSSARTKTVSPQEWLARFAGPTEPAPAADAPPVEVSAAAPVLADVVAPDLATDVVPDESPELVAPTDSAYAPDNLATPIPETAPEEPLGEEAPSSEPQFKEATHDAAQTAAEHLGQQEAKNQTRTCDQVIVLPDETELSEADPGPINIPELDPTEHQIDLRDHTHLDDAAPELAPQNAPTPRPEIDPIDAAVVVAQPSPNQAPQTTTGQTTDPSTTDPLTTEIDPAAAETASIATVDASIMPAHPEPVSEQLLPSPSVMLAYPEATQTQLEDLLPPPGQVQPRPISAPTPPRARPRTQFQPVTWTQASVQAGLTDQQPNPGQVAHAQASAGFLLPTNAQNPTSAQALLADVAATTEAPRPDPQVPTGEYLQPISDPPNTPPADDTDPNTSAKAEAPDTAPTTVVAPNRPQAGQALLELVGIKAKRGRQRALGGVDLTLKTGEIHAIIGPRNSGKSTLLRVCGGLLRPYSGRVIINEKRVHGPLHIPLAQAGIVTVSPDSLALPTLTVRENLGLAPVAGIAAEHVAEEVFARFPHLRAHADRTVGDLETVDHIILAFAKALLSAPRLLIVDDIAPAMSAYNHQVLSQVVHEIADSGTALLVANKDPFAVLAFSDHATVIQGGRSVYTGPATEVTQVLRNRGITTPE